jgi:glycosyltransferase involved in cell wall biosynthesis
MGFAYITQEMAKLFGRRYETAIIDLAPHSKRGGVLYHARRVVLTLKGIWPLLRGCLRPSRIFYVACEGKLGIVYTITLSAVGRLLGYRLFIHHHTFSYIDARSLLMTWLLRVVGQGATHIFLCPTMADCFVGRYGVPVKATILSNSALVEPGPAPPLAREPEEPLVIGLLSNLNDEKGLDLFIDLLSEAVAQGLNVKGVLAGPPQSDRDRDTISVACNELGQRLE